METKTTEKWRCKDPNCRAHGYYIREIEERDARIRKLELALWFFVRKSLDGLPWIKSQEKEG
jgi:hypothetical protein